MRHCPKCGDPLSTHGVCGSCDFGHRAAKAEVSARHPVHGYRLCEHEDRGQKCGGPGAFSSNLREGGPWFCFDHFPAFANWNSGKREAPPHGFAALRALLKPIDKEAEAERLAIQQESGK